MNLFKKAVIFVLTLESRLILSKYKPFIVAVTGSVGKTSTKDAIYAVLKNQSCYVRKSEKSLNSDIGLPLTVIGVPNAWHNFFGWLANIRAGAKLILFKKEYPNCLILEIGADHPGDIRNTVKWLHPDIAVITKVSCTPVHVEFFRSPEEVFEEKASLAEAVKPGGTVVLFADDDKVMSIGERVKAKGVMIISYGLNSTANVKGVDYSLMFTKNALTPKSNNLAQNNDANQYPKLSQDNHFLSGFKFHLEYNAVKFPITMRGIVGESYQYPLLAATAVGISKAMSMESIVKEMSSYTAPKGRMNVIMGINGSTIIDDSYNSSPDAAVVALQTLEQAAHDRDHRLAFLGDMMELGKFSAEEHRKIGKLAAGIVRRLVTVGQRSRLSAEEALTTGLSRDNVESFDSSTEAATQVTSLVKPGDVILIKGSQSVRMERLVKVLMAEPERAGELLVRQEKEWLEKV